MDVKVAGAGLKWNYTHPVSSRRSNGMFPCVRNWKSSLTGTLSSSTNLYRSSSLEFQKPRMSSLRRSCSASSDAFPDEEFDQLIHELALEFQQSDDDDDYECSSVDGESGMINDSMYTEKVSKATNSFPNGYEMDLIEPPWLGNWSPGEEIIPASIEWKATRVDLPLSLRIIQKKKQWKQGVKVVGEAAYSSVKKAFSSMVFIIRELHSYSLQMRELIQYHDLQETLSHVQMEMHASFVWLFQQVFSPTPTLMVYVMILLANYTVYSMGNSVAFAIVSPTSYMSAAIDSVSLADDVNKKDSMFDSPLLNSLTDSLQCVKNASVGGNCGDGGKLKRIASGTEGGDRFKNSGHFTSASSDETASVELSEEELKLWNSIIQEAAKMEEEFRDLALDHDTIKRFVSPVTAIAVEDDYTDYLRTELLYRTSIARDPGNALVLANYAQFLYLVAREFERAEYYFKKATSIEPPDAEAYNKYAMFLWMVKKDLWGAEETYLEAISAEPNNSYYTANYAHFLWMTGAEDTCYPLESTADESVHHQ